MIITIDTSKDSKEDIRKAISFLSSLHGDGSVSVDNSEVSESATNAFASMFGSSDSSQTDETQESPGFTNIFAEESNKEEVKDKPFEDPLKSLTEKKEETDEEPQVMMY